MVVQLFAFSFALAQEEAPKQALATQEHKFFSTIGMLHPSIALYEDEAITRGQFAYIAARLIGYDGESTPSISRFADVDLANPYLGAINHLYDAGVVRGTGNSSFNPDDAIIFNDASAIIVKILGYSQIASAKYGSYPICNIRMADELDIYLDITIPQGTDAITAEEALIMLFNAVYAPMPEMSVYGEESSTYTYDAKNTILYVYHRIVRAEGVVNDDGVSSVAGATTLKKGEAKIGDRKLKASANGFSVSGLLGAFVEYWYVEDTNELVYAVMDANNTNTLTLTYDELCVQNGDFSITNVVYYDKNDKIKNARIAMVADFVYNGASLGVYTVEDLKIESGYITFIDRNSDKIFDVVNVTEYCDYFVAGINKEDNVIYTKTASIGLDKYNVATIVDINGSALEFADITADSLISVAASKDNSCITVVKCGAPASGVVTQASVDEYIYYMGEREYKLSNGFVNTAKSSDYPEIGNDYNFYINADGDVANVKLLDSDAWHKGYLIGVSQEGSGISTAVSAGIIGTDNSFIKYYVGDKIILNGQRVAAANVATHNAVYNSNQNIPIRQPVKYKLDEWGDLKEIETPVDITVEADPQNAQLYPYNFDLERFSKDRHYDSAEWKGDNINAIKGIYFVSSNSLVVRDPYLDDPSGAYQYDDVDVCEFSEYKNFRGLTYADLYDIDEANNVGYVIFRRNNKGANEGAWQYSLFVVESVYKKLQVDDNGDLEVVTIVSGGQAGQKATIYEDKELFELPSTLRNGDVCLVELEGTYIKNLKVLTNVSDTAYDESGNEVYQSPIGSGFIYSEKSDSFIDNDLYIYSGAIYGSSDSGLVTFGWEPDVKLLGSSYNNSPAKAMTIYDRETGKVTFGTRKDIYTNIIPDSTNEVQPDDYTPRAVVYRRLGYLLDMIFVK